MDVLHSSQHGGVIASHQIQLFLFCATGCSILHAIKGYRDGAAQCHLLGRLNSGDAAAYTHFHKQYTRLLL